MSLPTGARIIPALAKCLTSPHLAVQAQALRLNCMQHLGNRFYAICPYESPKRPWCDKKEKDLCGKDKVGDPCRKASRKDRTKQEKSISMRLWPDCCLTKEMECVLDRYDLDHYKMTPMSKRKFQVTWVECGELKIQPMKRCSYEKLPWPQMKRRKRGEQPHTARMPPACTADDLKGSCLCFKLPGCRAARRPPKCGGSIKKPDCERYKAPYPCYSECKKAKVRPARMRECQCLASSTGCDLVRRLAELEERKKRLKRR